ncbi:MAG: CidA/LrgA family protein [Clostridia bacterium]|nr:CidA/LrgA family protein [Clostridia bacterium]
MKILLQLAGIFTLCVMSEGVAALLPFAFPGSAIAMVLLFLGFLFKLVKPSQIQESSDFLLNNMAIFFVPAGVGLMECFDRIRSSLGPIFVICILSTVLTFAATAYTVRLVVYFQKKHRERRLRRG